MCPCCFDWVTTCTVKAASNVRCGAMRVRTLSGRFDSDRVHPWQCAGDLVFTESFETFSQVNLSESFRCMVWSANHSKLKVLEKGGIMPKNPDIPQNLSFGTTISIRKPLSSSWASRFHILNSSLTSPWKVLLAVKKRVPIVSSWSVRSDGKISFPLMC